MNPDGQVHEWIKVEDRMPETDVDVLTYGPDAGVTIAAHWQDDVWMDDFMGAISVTHWMPLPEPPK